MNKIFIFKRFLEKEQYEIKKTEVEYMITFTVVVQGSQI